MESPNYRLMWLEGGTQILRLMNISWDPNRPTLLEDAAQALAKEVATGIELHGKSSLCTWEQSTWSRLLCSRLPALTLIDASVDALEEKLQDIDHEPIANWLIFT